MEKPGYVDRTRPYKPTTMQSSEEIKTWYNTFSEKQVATGTNLRHYTIFAKLLDSGLKKHHKVLEIGCGIGTLTKLIHAYLKKGELVATDISDESIEIARKRISKSHKINFQVTDMKNFSHPAKFDFIVLADVLEHIPLEQHGALFDIISKQMHEKSIVLINIPHPKALDFLRSHTPEKLQIIDQSIGADEMILNAYAANLELIDYTSYSLFNKENDSVLIRFKKKSEITLTELSKPVIIKRKLIKRIRYYLAKGVF